MDSKIDEIINPFDIWNQIKSITLKNIIDESCLKDYYNEFILQHESFEKGLVHILSKKLANQTISFELWSDIFNQILQKNSNLIQIALLDLLAIKKNDPACDSLLTAFLFFKGYKALQLYRLAHELWIEGRKHLALLIQSVCSEIFGVDIHPGAVIGQGCMMDHATGIVIGETCVIGLDCCIYHGVTLGGTGKVSSDRHPKVGNNVIIGCGTSILGNIPIGSDSKIGAGSIIVKPVKPSSTILTCLAKEFVKND